MLELMENQKRAPSIVGCLSMFCCPGLVAQSILCAMFCPISMDHCFTWLPCCYGDWYAGLQKWQTDVNLVLNRNDMHVKLIIIRKIFTQSKFKLNQYMFGYGTVPLIRSYILHLMLLKC